MGRTPDLECGLLGVRLRNWVILNGLGWFWKGFGHQDLDDVPLAQGGS